MYGSLRNAQVLNRLRSFCRGEMSAVEAYTTALQHRALAPYSDTLRNCQLSHHQRVRMLKRRIAGLGGQIPKSSGPWGAITDVMEEAANFLGAGPALTVLEEGEGHGVRDYRADMKLVDDDTRRFLEEQIYPEQVATYRTIEELHKVV